LDVSKYLSYTKLHQLPRNFTTNLEVDKVRTLQRSWHYW